MGINVPILRWRNEGSKMQSNPQNVTGFYEEIGFLGDKLIIMSLVTALAYFGLVLILVTADIPLSSTYLLI